MQSLTPTELEARLKDEQTAPLLLDVREPWEFEVCHIAGSRHCPMSNIPQAIEELDPSKPTVVICHHGVRSLQVARFMESKGFGQVFNLEGGVDAWAQEIDPTMARY